MQGTADLVPLNSRRVAVKFDTFKIASLVSVAFSSHSIIRELSV